MKTFNAFIDEMMTAGTGGFTSAADAKGPVAGYDLPFGGMIKRWYTAAKATSKRKKNERN